MQQFRKKSTHLALSKQQKIIISLATATFLFSGCGGGGGGTTPTDNTSTEKTAYLIDSAVEGIDYTCGTITGTTDSTGKFTYDSTKCSTTGVEFKLGNLSLGTILPSAINSDTYLTIQELVGTTRDNVTDGNVTKLAVLLQSLDNDNNASNGIYITQTIKNAITLTGNIKDRNDSELSAEIQARGKTEKDANDAISHLLQTATTKGITITSSFSPTDFNLTSVTGTALNMQTSSNTITIAGLTIPTYITISSGSEYKINNGEWKSTKSLVRNDDNVTVRHTTANSLSGTTTTTLKIGGVTKAFGSTTKSTLVFQSGETWKGLTYNTITSSVTGKVWLDRNLGATQVCTLSNNMACYGDYYQWGRNADGHQLSNSTKTSTLATNLDTTGNSSFIKYSSSSDWTTVDGDGALRSANWSKTDGTSICPIGYRVPTIDELLAETILNSSGAYTKLKLPPAGFHLVLDSQQLFRLGEWGRIWSSSPDIGQNSKMLKFDSSSADWDYENRNLGQSVRCLRD